MDALEEKRRHASAPFVVAMMLAAIVGVSLGCYGSIFGPYYAIAIGAVLAIVGVIGAARGVRWCRVLLAFGAAVMLGAALYFLIGVLMPDGASSGFGSGCATGGSCK